jgi:hypothetical protein
MNKSKNTSFQGSLFEDDYLIRTLGNLATSPEIALTELVANAWDAGATDIKISIPEAYGEKIIIEDNGIGLTPDQFHNRWMRLGYNRIKHQGKIVLFPKGISGNRIAYGRNGVGRHGLLCFNSEYTVITMSGGTKSTFIVTTSSGEQPFVIKDEKYEESKLTGTRLEVKVSRNLPSDKRIQDILSARFLHDPSFKVTINKKNVPLEQHNGLIDTKNLTVDNINLIAHFIDTQKVSKNTIYQGVAFWQRGRLIGEPSWILGRDVIIDGRTKYAKRFTVVVESNDLADYITEDWTGFKYSEVMNKVYLEVANYINEILGKFAKENIEETKYQIRQDFAQDYKTLSALAKFEVDEAIENITEKFPTAKPESISLAVDAIINLEKTRTGKELLLKLSRLSENDISGLNQLLEKWSVKDALIVLNEIDRRISVIEAIRKLSPDKDTDELHVLHPLVTDARWLFGPEFESAEYASNRQLQTAVSKIFKVEVGRENFNNHKQRPDIVISRDSSFSITGIEMLDSESSLAVVSKIMIIELKKGGFKLNRKERDQAVGYVEDFMNCGSIIGNPYIDAFVVGDSFSEKLQPIHTVQNSNNVEMGKIRVSTFAQLVDTAEKRLFGLREKLNDRYEDVLSKKIYSMEANSNNIIINELFDGTNGYSN